MAGSPKRGRKRQSKYIPHAPKRRKGLELRSGMQGFLITCVGGKERIAAREAIHVLERFYDTLGEEKADLNGTKGSLMAKDQQHLSPHNEVQGFELWEEDRLGSCKNEQPESCNNKCEEASAGSSESEEERNEGTSQGCTKKTTVESLLEEELADLRDVQQARFANTDTGCAGVLFVRMLSSDVAHGIMESGPNQVVQAILEDCITKKIPLTRFCLRLLPIEITCYASVEEVKKLAEPCLLRHFPVVEEDKALKFAIVYEARANSSLDRMEMINAVAKLVPKPHSVDLKNPDKTILLQVVKTVCAIGVVDGYKKYAKYNLRELTCSSKEE